MRPQGGTAISGWRTAADGRYEFGDAGRAALAELLPADIAATGRLALPDRPMA